MTERTIPSGGPPSKEDIYAFLEQTRGMPKWEAEKKYAEFRREHNAQQERAARQAELESYLQRRARTWGETTGSPPPMRVMEDWQAQYLDAKEAEAEAEREAKLTELKREHYDRL